jgi:hypothetical protein
MPYAVTKIRSIIILLKQTVQEETIIRSLKVRVGYNYASPKSSLTPVVLEGCSRGEGTASN